MKLVFYEKYGDDLADAIIYYSTVKDDLGKRFEHEVKQTLQKIKDFPKMGSVHRNNIRRRLVKKFPYTVYYEYIVEDNTIYVLKLWFAIRHPRDLGRYLK
ncbi:MAG: type II toxin-antitoxin system RelE/ParE family toxin [Candidatus Nomurabacteria bacterium]|jgi:plasmid stabilization system protein ParE|nr:type II toxin-antitoxin system RelE/ParE family toxin [Candidatus Nomurabacteria bacterium]